MYTELVKMEWIIISLTTIFILIRLHTCSQTCTYGELKLINNGFSNDMKGRVEVCINDQQGTVCDDSWDYWDAQVACKQLGLPYTGAIAYGSAHFGQGTGFIISGVQCTGDETSLFSCTYNNSSDSCTHSNDAGVLCQERECTEGDIWLTGGQTICEGTVNICYHGVWNTICDTGWSPTDASVVCRQLGYSTDNIDHILSYSSGQNGPVYIQKVQCNGTESRLLDCEFMDQSKCMDRKSSGVNCNCTQSSTQCKEGDVRLTGDKRNTTCEGTVEICFRGRWGTVCNNYWQNRNDASVVCRQLGYSANHAVPYTHAYFGHGTGLINIDRVRCKGNETSLLNCYYIPQYHCFHSQEAGVKCNCADTANCTCELLPSVSTTVFPLDTSTYISMFTSSPVESFTSPLSSSFMLISSMIPLTAVTPGVSSMALTTFSVETKSTATFSSTTAQLFSSIFSTTQTRSTCTSSFIIPDTTSIHSMSHMSAIPTSSSTVERLPSLTSTAEAHWLTSSSAAVIQMSSSIDLLSSPAAVTSPSNTAAHHSLKEDFIIAGSVTGAVVFIAVIVLVSLTVFCLIRRYRRCSNGDDQELSLWRDDVTDTIFGPDDDNS